MSQNVHQKNGTLYLPGSRRRRCSCWAHVLKYTRSPSRAGFLLYFLVGVCKSKKRKKSKKVYILSGPFMVYSKR